MGKYHFHSKKLLNRAQCSSGVVEDIVKKKHEHLITMKTIVVKALQLLCVVTASNEVMKGPLVGKPASKLRFNRFLKSAC